MSRSCGGFSRRVSRAHIDENERNDPNPQDCLLMLAVRPRFQAPPKDL